MKTIIVTDKAPKAIGPYSQAVKAGGFVFCSGQIAIDPVTGQMISGGIEEQTRRVMDNIKELLIASGSSLEKLVKTTIFLKNMNDFSVVNEVYGSYFVSDPPARETVEVARIPKDALVEIGVIAVE